MGAKSAQDRPKTRLKTLSHEKTSIFTKYVFASAKPHFTTPKTSQDRPKIGPRSPQDGLKTVLKRDRFQDRFYDRFWVVLAFVLATSWAVLGAQGAVLGPSWAHLGRPRRSENRAMERIENVDPAVGCVKCTQDRPRPSQDPPRRPKTPPKTAPRRPKRPPRRPQMIPNNPQDDHK